MSAENGEPASDSPGPARARGTGATEPGATRVAKDKDGKRVRPPAGKSVGWALVQAARLHRARVGDRLAELGLFAGQEQVVQALAVAGSMTMGDLAATLRVRPPTASKTISRLAALGFVERRAEAGDGRVVRARLTEAGLAKAAAIEKLWEEVEAELLDGFEGKEKRRLRKLLRKAASNLADAAGVSGHEADAESDPEDDAEPLLGPAASDTVGPPS